VLRFISFFEAFSIGLKSVQAHLAFAAPERNILELDKDTATVTLPR
jgi:hypothetical protein